MNRPAYQIILAPLVTEKSTRGIEHGRFEQLGERPVLAHVVQRHRRQDRPVEGVGADPRRVEQGPVQVEDGPAGHGAGSTSTTAL